MNVNPLHQPITSSIESILLGLDLQRIITVSSKEYSITDPSGAISVQKIYTSIVLVDGTTWNPLHALRNNDPVLLAVCATCRRGVRYWFHEEPPTHGLLAAPNAAHCCECGETTCPRHRKLCTDGQVRCLRCARRYQRWAWLRALLWKEVEEG
jgi:hypothetical protein